MERLLKHDYVTPRLKSSLQKFYSRHHVLIDRYKISSSWTDWPLQNIVIMNWLTVTKYCHHELIDRYKISSSCTDWPLQNIVIMNWLTVTKIPYLKWQWIFSLLHIICLSSIDYCRQDFYWTWLYIWATQRVSYNKQKLLTLCEYLSSTRLSGVEHVAHILVFCVVFFFVLFVFILCPMLPVSLDCPFLIVPLVYSNVYSGRFHIFYSTRIRAEPVVEEMFHITHSNYLDAYKV